MNSRKISTERELIKASRPSRTDINFRSIYISNVHYAATADQLEQHFLGCGLVKRVTIPRNRLSGLPRGIAYIEFVKKDSIEAALALHRSRFCQRVISVYLKRSQSERGIRSAPVVAIQQTRSDGRASVKKRQRDEDDQSELKRLKGEIVHLKEKLQRNIIRRKRKTETNILDDLVVQFQKLRLSDQVGIESVGKKQEREKIELRSIVRKNGTIAGGMWRKVIEKRNGGIERNNARLVRLPVGIANRKKAEVLLRKSKLMFLAT